MGICLRPGLVVITIAGLNVPSTIAVWAQDQAFAANKVGNEISALEQPEQESKKPKITDAFKQGLDAYLKGDFATAHATWLPLAEQGDAVSAFNLGVLYARGQGTAADPARAVHWYRRAADAGYVLAQFNLGAAYMTGQGVEEDHNRAAQWWAVAAKNGHPQALFNLGTLYLHGDGVPLDRARALNLFQKAADLGDKRAYKKLQALKDPTAPPPAALEADAFRPATKSGSVKTPASPTRAMLQGPSTRSAGSNTKVADAGTKDPVLKSEQKPGKTTVARWGTVAQNAGPSATTKQAPSANKPERTSSPVSEMRDSRFLAAADPQSWTIQVSAFTARSQAEEFINRHGLRAEAILVEARVKDRTWYKVLYGVYENEAQARRGIDRLSKVLRKRSPWARRIGVVKEELVLQVPAKADTDNARINKSSMSKQSTETTTKPKTARGWRSVAPAPRASPKPEPQKPVSQRNSSEPLQEQKPPAEPTQVATRKSVSSATASQRELFQKGQSAFNDQDYKTALEYWTPLAAQGMDEAQYGLGFMYESGWGVKKDYIRAYQWYRRAAEQGHAQSQFNLGLLYQAGLGIPKNEALANYWIQSAADRDDPRAKEFLRNLQQKSQR